MISTDVCDYFKYSLDQWSLFKLGIEKTKSWVILGEAALCLQLIYEID